MDLDAERMDDTERVDDTERAVCDGMEKEVQSVPLLFRGLQSVGLTQGLTATALYRFCIGLEIARAK